MTLKTFIRNIVAPEYDSMVTEIADKTHELAKDDIIIEELKASVVNSTSKINTGLVAIDLLNQQLASLKPTTDLELFLDKKYNTMSNIAFTQKRKTSLGNNVNILLNELITPDSFCVQNMFRRIVKVDDRKDYFIKLGDKNAKTLTWTNDKNLSTSGDYYLFPNETISDKTGDCEDHAFVMCSASAEIGGCWGFYNGGGHAFNCFVYNDQLYVLDTVGDAAFIIKYEGQTAYDIRFIITKNKTYRVGAYVSFGTIAGWDEA